MKKLFVAAIKEILWVATINILLFFIFEIIASFLLLFPPSNLYSYKTLIHAPINNPNDAQWVKMTRKWNGSSWERKGIRGMRVEQERVAQVRLACIGYTYENITKLIISTINRPLRTLKWLLIFLRCLHQSSI